jgi:Na+:H+ antiporter, NhaC family
MFDVLVPLGVSTLLYAPWAVFCYAIPALSVLYGVTGFKIEKVEPTALDQPTREMS